MNKLNQIQPNRQRRATHAGLPASSAALPSGHRRDDDIGLTGPQPGAPRASRNAHWDDYFTLIVDGLNDASAAGPTPKRAGGHHHPSPENVRRNQEVSRKLSAADGQELSDGHLASLEAQSTWQMPLQRRRRVSLEGVVDVYDEDYYSDEDDENFESPRSCFDEHSPPTTTRCQRGDATKAAETTTATAATETGDTCGQSGDGRWTVYAISDLHTDMPANMRWVKNMPCYPPRTALIVAGDIATAVNVIRETLTHLKSKFEEVFYCPGEAGATPASETSPRPMKERDSRHWFQPRTSNLEERPL